MYYNEVMDFTKPKIMGILNITPDSFSDGEQHLRIQDSVLRIQQFINDGVDIIDIGGESTGPGSIYVSAKEEFARVKPVIDHITEHQMMDKVMFSIDTYKSEIAEYALEHGFGMINDVTALRGDTKMINVLVTHQPYVVIMYAKDNTPRTTMEKVEYDDVIATIKTFLLGRIATLVTAGFPQDRIIIDPRMGMFVSANPQYSFEIIDRLSGLKQLGYPILIGTSRKSFLGGKVNERDEKSWQLAKRALQNGASVVRMHEVRKVD